jgi:hypothetical protein
MVNLEVRWPREAPYISGTQVKTTYIARSLRDEVPNAPEQLHDVPPIGDLLTFLLQRLAWEHPDVRKLAFYFERALGREFAGVMRTWPTNVFSKGVRQRVDAGAVRGESGGWDEWEVTLP